MLGRERFVGKRVVGDDLHAKRLGPDRHRFADPSQAGESQGFAPQRHVGLTRPASVVDGRVLEHQIFGQRQDQHEAMLADGILIGAGHGGDHHAVIGCRLHVDGIVTHPDAGDDLQLRIGLEDLAGVRFGTGDGGRDPREDPQHFALHQLPAESRIHQLKTAFIQDIQKPAGHLGEGGGGNQHFWHGRGFHGDSARAPWVVASGDDSNRPGDENYRFGGTDAIFPCPRVTLIAGRDEGSTRRLREENDLEAVKTRAKRLTLPTARR